MTRRSKSVWLALVVMIAVLWTFLPMYWTIKFAFMSKTEIARFPPMLLPHQINLASFYNIFGFDYRGPDNVAYLASGQARQIILGLRNSFIIAVIVTAITTLVVVPLAYVFARLQFPGRAKLLTTILLSVSLPPVSTLIPFYSLYVQLGLTGSMLGLVIVVLTITIPIVAWMLIGFFRNLPPIERLARIDGFSRLYVLVCIVVPMARSGILVTAVIAFLFSWNEYVYAQVLVTGSEAVTLPAAMSGFLFQVPEPSQLAASLLLSLLPPFAIAFFLQKHIAEMNIA